MSKLVSLFLALAAGTGLTLWCLQGNSPSTTPDVRRTHDKQATLPAGENTSEQTDRRSSAPSPERTASSSVTAHPNREHVKPTKTLRTYHRMLMLLRRNGYKAPARPRQVDHGDALRSSWAEVDEYLKGEQASQRKLANRIMKSRLTAGQFEVQENPEIDLKRYATPAQVKARVMETNKDRTKNAAALKPSLAGQYVVYQTDGRVRRVVRINPGDDADFDRVSANVSAAEQKRLALALEYLTKLRQQG